MPQANNAPHKEKSSTEDEDFENQVFKFDRKSLTLFTTKSNGEKMETPETPDKAQSSMQSIQMEQKLPNFECKSEVSQCIETEESTTKDPFEFVDDDEDTFKIDFTGDTSSSTSTSKDIYDDEIITDNTSNDETECQTEVNRNEPRTKRKCILQAKEKRKSQRLRKKTTFCNKKYQTQLMKKLTAILKKDKKAMTKEDMTTLDSYPNLVLRAKKRLETRLLASDRLKEQEDNADLLQNKCVQLATAIRKAKYLIVYTGAGISTSANIPDYRGPQGVWTLMQKGQAMCDNSNELLTTADPTLTHMALKALYESGIVKHIVSQNCDGLHIRSGIPKAALSEVHGNMYIEVCSSCHREYVRTFDVTENTRRFFHRTGRFCFHCKAPLKDTIVHFGEKGSMRWPLNWAGAEYHADQADMILCLGSSLKVLRRYQFLWCMDKPFSQRPKLYIVNLQWTPKDQYSALKINGKCDVVLDKLMSLLNIEISKYERQHDPIFSIATPLHPCEQESKGSQDLTFPEGVPYPPKKIDLNNYIRLECGKRAPPKPCKVSRRTEDVSESNSKIQDDDSNNKNGQSSSNVKGWFGNNWGMKTKKRR